MFKRRALMTSALASLLLTSAAGAGATAVAAGPAPNYYFSPHAERVFATQAGSVAITWVTNSPVDIDGDPVQRYRF